MAAKDIVAPCRIKGPGSICSLYIGFMPRRPLFNPTSFPCTSCNAATTASGASLAKRTTLHTCVGSVKHCRRQARIGSINRLSVE